MVSLNKIILRVSIIVLYVMMISLLVAGASAIFGYLNTGADRSTMLHTEIKKVEQYLPKVEWSEMRNEGRPMDKENLNSIQNDYLDAWYIRGVAYKSNKTYGVDDYFTDNARKNIYDFVALNKAANISIESTTLNHQPTLEYFSEDGQLVVITDRDVVEFKRFYKGKKMILETKEQSTYKSILLLEDGFWRIRHMVKEENEPFEEIKGLQSDENYNIKGINYYPQDTPWNTFGDAFSEEIIDKDFKIIKDAGLNSIRIFIQYEDFGKANVPYEKLEKLTKLMNLAAKNDLRVVVTLFDFFGDYTVLNWTLNQRHAESIVSHIKDHPALLAWDIKNEPNLDFNSRGKERVVSWLENMIDLVKSVDSEHPVTIGWSDIKSASILKDKLDFISFHYYLDIHKLDKAVKELRKEIPDKQFVLQEFGLSSYKGFWFPIGKNEEDQAAHHQLAQKIIADNNLQFMSWTLYDFTDIPKEVVGRLPWRKNMQKRYGFIDIQGNKKPSYQYISGYK